MKELENKYQELKSLLSDYIDLSKEFMDLKLFHYSHIYIEKASRINKQLQNVVFKLNKAKLEACSL